MSNLGFIKLWTEGLRYEQTAVGDKYVDENMMENDTAWRRTVRTYHFQQICSNRRWNPDFSYDHGSMCREKVNSL